MANAHMSISAFSRRSLLSIKALRLYDEMGLLRPDFTESSSGYRYYSDAQLESARRISLLRKLDVPLAVISEILALSTEDGADRLSSWWSEEEERMMRRKDLFRYIQDASSPSDSEVGGADGYDVRVCDNPAATYLYVTRHVHGPELPAYIVSSEHTLNHRADTYGGALGLATVVFHGVADLDSDGPVDVCIPIAAGSAPVDDGLIRTETAHKQAYITLTRPQIAFPQILRVYGALRRWISTNGYVISGPPREICLADYKAVTSREPLCHVAFPVEQ